MSNCPLYTYQNQTNRTCLLCDSSCLSCSGPSNFECITCIIPTMVISTPPSQCQCSNGSYFNDTLNICALCDNSCVTCSGYGSLSCSKCKSNSFLQSNLPPSSCDTTCKSGSYLNTMNNTCPPCDVSCLNCSQNGENYCTACFDGTFLLNFPGPSSCKSSCSAGFYPDNSTKTCKICDSSCKECVDKGIFNCTVCKSGYYLQGGDGLKSNTTGKCITKPVITPMLQTNTKDLSYLLIFSSNYSSIYSLYSNKTNISIDGLSSSSYKYTITAITNTEMFSIDFSVTCSILNNSLITIYLNPPPEILSNSTIQLNNYTLQSYMKYYYFIDSKTIKMINQTTQATKTLNSVITNTFIVNNLLYCTSTLIFQFMISLDTIRFLRYFEVKYPENVLSIFETKIQTIDIAPITNLYEDQEDGKIPEIFQKYGISNYSFNNIGNCLIEALNYWAVGIICLIIVKTFHYKKNKYFKIILIIASIVFVWSYAISYLLSNYIALSFYTFLSFRYPTTHTKTGSLNLFFSTLVSSILVLIFPFVLIKIYHIRSNIALKTDKSLNKVHNIDNHNNTIFSSIALKTDKSLNKVHNIDINNNNSPKIYPELKTNHDTLVVENLDEIHIISPMNDSLKPLNDKLSETPVEKKKTNTNTKDNNSDLNRYCSLYQDFKHNNRIQSYFILWYLFKQLLYCLIITVSYDNPFYGLLMANIINILYFISLIVINPFKKFKNVFQNLFNEGCGIIAMSLAFSMAYLDKQNIIDEDLKMKLGWGIIISNLMLILTFLVRIIFGWTLVFYQLFKELIKIVKRYRNFNKVFDEIFGNKKMDKGLFDKIMEMEICLR